MLNRRATDLLERYRELDRQASGIATEIRKLSKSTPVHQSANPPRRLRETVVAAFEARQELQRIELAQLRQRLARIEENIETRQRIKDAIVEHRVKELLEPDLRWAQPGEEGATPVNSSAGQEASKPKPRELRIDFRYAPWRDVLEWLARQADLSLVTATWLDGTFNYRDSREYTVDEAIDLVNFVLLAKGCTLVRRDRMLMAIKLADVAHSTRSRRHRSTCWRTEAPSSLSACCSIWIRPTSRRRPTKSKCSSGPSAP